MNFPNSHTEFSAKNANVKKNRLFKMAGSRKISVHKYKPILVNRTVHAPAIKNYEHAASMIMMIFGM